MKTKSLNLLLAAALIAGLAFIASLTFQRPTAVRYADNDDAAATRTVLDDESVAADARPGNEAIPAPAMAATVEDDIDYPPAHYLFLEAVLLEGRIAEKKEAIGELRRLGTDDAVRTLSLALSDYDARVRDKAFEALAAIGSEEALAAIASRSPDGDPGTRADAAETLADADNSFALDYLALLLGDEDPRVRIVAIESLSDYRSDRALSLISRALRDPDPEVRERASDVLDEFSDETLFHDRHPVQ